MSRRILLAAALAVSAPVAAAQSLDAFPDPEVRLRAEFARIGVPFPDVAPTALPLRSETDLAESLDDPEARVARQIAAARAAPPTPAPESRLLSAAGDILLRGSSTILQIRGTDVGELHTWQGIDVGAGATISATTGTLVFRADRSELRFLARTPQTIGRMRTTGSGRVVLDSLGTASFTIGTLTLGSRLETATNLTVTTALDGSGGFALTGPETQTLALPASQVSQSLWLEKPSGTVVLASPTVFSGLVRNAGVARLLGGVTIGETGTLELAGGTLTLGQDLDVFGVLQAGSGTLATAGFTARLAPTVSGSTITRLAAVGGDGSALGSALVYERPHLDGEGWRMIAAPFASVAFSQLNDDFHTQGATGAGFPGGLPNLYRWVPANPPGQRYIGVTDFTQAFVSGRGYFLYAYGLDPGSGTPILPTVWDVMGLEPVGPVQTPLSFDFDDAERRWNLLGNPFAAPLDWHAVQAAGSFQQAYALWDPAASGGLGSYAYYSSAGVPTGRAGRYVPAFQGFWAEASAGSPFALTFDRAWKAPAASVVYAGFGEETVPHLRMRLEGEGLTAPDAVALFADGGAADADPLDFSWLVPMSAEHASVFFVRDGDGRRLAFEGRAPAADQLLALDVETTRPGTYTLSWPDLDPAPAGPLRLVDTATGASVDLRQTSNYRFTVGTPAAPGADGRHPASPSPGAMRSEAPRFALYLGSGATAGEPQASAPSALVVEAPRPNPSRGTTAVRIGTPSAGPVVVRVYDALGRAVATLSEGERSAGWHEVTTDVSWLPPGVYVVRVHAGETSRTVRLTITR